jgi:hypothetical protein
MSAFFIRHRMARNDRRRKKITDWISLQKAVKTLIDMLKSITKRP